MSTSKQARSGQEFSSVDHAETVAILTESAVPTLYRHNGFRVLDLPADATARDISRRKQTVEKALSHDVPVPPGPGRYFPLAPQPDQFAVRDAMQRLSDPERRLIDELFWFWPHSQGQSATDEALSHLLAGKDKQAEGVWLEQESDNGESSISTHNLALLYHFRALEKELEQLQAGPGLSDADGVAKVWERSFRRWRSLTEQEGFWSRLTSRIRELEDPRLTSGTARRIRSALPSALLSICCQLVLQGIEAGQDESATRLVETINKSGFSDAEIKQAIRTAIEPVRDRVKGLCEAAELATKNDPIHADTACTQLLVNAKPLLDGLDYLLPADDPTRGLAYDDVAERALRCQVAFVRNTDKWKQSILLLESALPFAASESVRKQLQENIDIVKKRADMSDEFRGEQYYDAPAEVLEQLEKARELTDKQEFEQAIRCLEELLSRPSGSISTEHCGLVSKALAYCLGCRAIKRMNEAFREWDDCTTTVINDIQSRVKSISNMSWECASKGTIPQYVSCPCMACGTAISGRYTTLKWTFNESKGAVDLIICGDCARRHRSQIAGYKNKLKEAALLSAQEYVDAGVLDPANKFVQKEIQSMRTTCTNLGVSFPSPLWGKGKTVSSATPKTAAARPLPTFWQRGADPKLAKISLGLGIALLIIGSFLLSESAILCLLGAGAVVFCGHMALKEADGGTTTSRKQAVGGLIFGYLFIALAILSMSNGS